MGIAVLCLTLLAVAVLSDAQSAPSAPPFPVWPQQVRSRLIIIRTITKFLFVVANVWYFYAPLGQFSVDFDVKVPAYGPAFVKKGALFYDYTIQTARADYYDWCIPLFGKKRSTAESSGLYNVTCSFLMTPKAAYFISADFEIPADRCCLFGDIPPPTPDWLKNTQYNRTEWLRGHYSDKWYFPGTDDPSDPYYMYWDDHYNQKPVRFFGLASIGVTILDYTKYTVGPIKDKSIFNLPSPSCSNECQSPPEDFVDPFLNFLRRQHV